jgi:hypothetical protein
VSNFVKGYCGRSFIDYNTLDKIEYFNGYDITTYYLEEPPIIAVSELAYTEDYGQTYVALVEYTDYLVNTKDSRIDSLYTGFTTYNHWNSIRITYTGGYTVVPEDIVLACYSLIDYYKDEQYLKKVSVSGDEKASNDGIGPSALPPNVKRILDLYRVNIG